MSPRQRTRLVLGLMTVLLLAAAHDGARLLELRQWNDRIVDGPLLPLDRPQPDELRFAHAHARAASGASQEALDLYRALQSDTPLGQAARFNSANLLVREAVEVRKTAQPGQAIPLLELAKETYREVLRHDPDHWPARYNLERAQRLLPDVQGDEEIAGPARNAERAATTMRAYAPGLP